MTRSLSPKPLGLCGAFKLDSTRFMTWRFALFLIDGGCFSGFVPMAGL